MRTHLTNHGAHFGATQQAAYVLPPPPPGMEWHLADGWQKREINSQPYAGDIVGWHYAKSETKKVPLGPEDVPPFSVIRRKDEAQEWHWRLLNYVHGSHARCGDRAYSWTEMREDYEINRSIPLTGKWNPDAWEPCYKEVAV